MSSGQRITNGLLHLKLAADVLTFLRPSHDSITIYQRYSTHAVHHRSETSTYCVFVIVVRPLLVRAIIVLTKLAEDHAVLRHYIENIEISPLK
jgi:hypothetical protein